MRASFVSHSPDHQDVVLHRALGHLAHGVYVDATARSDLAGRATLALCEQGWTGTAVFPAEAGVTQWTEARPHDAVVRPDQLRALSGDPIHLVVVGADDRAVATLLELHPWVVLLAPAGGSATVPPDAEPVAQLTAAGYEQTLFDGTSRFFVSADRRAEIGAALSYPACTRDDFAEATTARLVAERDELLDEVVRWRGRAIDGWAGAGPGATPLDEPGLADLVAVRGEIAALHQTLSWRITGPLRSLRRAGGR